MQKKEDLIMDSLGLVPVVDAEIVEALEEAAKPEKRRRGRPLKFPTVEVLQAGIDSFFKKCDEHQKEVVAKNGDVVLISSPLPYTVSGLAVHLDTDRETLMNYEAKEEYFDTVKRAKERCLADSEMRLHTNFTAGVIFSMKNNYGWKDQIDVNTNQNMVIEVKPPSNIFRDDD